MSATGQHSTTDNLVYVSDTAQGDAATVQKPTSTIELIGISIIAGWFGVTRPAVSHWMDRHLDFPAPDVRIRQPGKQPGAPVSYVYGWRPEREDEIREWERSRPGQGAGGGRPWPARAADESSNTPPANM